MLYLHPSDSDRLAWQSLQRGLSRENRALVAPFCVCCSPKHPTVVMRPTFFCSPSTRVGGMWKSGHKSAPMSLGAVRDPRPANHVLTLQKNPGHGYLALG